MYPLKEVLLLITCATIAGCDDFDDIAAWGEHHRRTPLHQHQDRGQGRFAHRILRPQQHRHALLYLLGAARYRAYRQGRTRPLGRRKHALVARRRVQRRSFPLAHRPWRQKHGCRAGLRAQSRACKQNQGKHQDPPKTRGLEPRIPATNPPAQMTLTWIPSRGVHSSGTALVDPVACNTA
jgi:hypothetical protein